MKEKDSKWGWKIAGLVSAGVLTATALYQLYHATPPADFNDVAYDWDTMGTELSEYVSRGQSDDSLLEEIDRALSGQGVMKRKKGMKSLPKHRNLRDIFPSHYKMSHLKQEVERLRGSTLGFDVVQKGRKKYAVVYVLVDKLKGSSIGRVIRKAISMSLPLLKHASPSIVAFSFLLGKNFITSIAKELSEKADSPDSSKDIILAKLKEKYPTSSVLWRKLLIDPFFQSLLLGPTFKGVSKLDPTGVTSKIQQGVDKLMDATIKGVSEAIQTCPTCHATEPVSKSAWSGLKGFKIHVASHLAKDAPQELN